MVVDCFCGCAVAMKEHKCGCVLAVVAAGMADLTVGQVLGNLPVELPFQYSVLFCPMVAVWYILTEMRSILENAIKMGAPVPAFLKKTLELTLDAMNDTGEKLTANRENENE